MNQSDLKMDNQLVRKQCKQATIKQHLQTLFQFALEYQNCNKSIKKNIFSKALQHWFQVRAKTKLNLTFHLLLIFMHVFERNWMQFRVTNISNAWLLLGSRKAWLPD